MDPRTIQTTFLPGPRRGRALAAKVGAVRCSGPGSRPSPSPDHWWAWGCRRRRSPGRGSATPWSWSSSAQRRSGARYNIGTALGNGPAALTGTYVLMLAVLPVLAASRPTLARALSPSDPLVSLASGQAETTPVRTLAGWLVVTVAAGFVGTRRRAVQ